MTNEELIAKIKAAIERRKGYISVTHFAEELLSFLSTLESEKPVPADLEEAAKEYCPDYAYPFSPAILKTIIREAFIAGAKWQKEQMMDEPK